MAGWALVPRLIQLAGTTHSAPSTDSAASMTSGTVIAELDVERAAALIEDGTAREGMAAKLQAARRAVERGVARVRIGNLAAVQSATAGTVITLSTTAV